MKKRYLFLFIFFVLFLLINVLLIADNVKYYVKIVDKEGKDHTGELIGFEYPSYPAILDEYIFAYDENWKGRNIYFRATPLITFSTEISPKTHPTLKENYIPMIVKIKGKEKLYFVNENSSIYYYKDKTKKEKIQVMINNISQMAIYFSPY